jgi:hypothetical protein
MCSPETPCRRMAIAMSKHFDRIEGQVWGFGRIAVVRAPLAALNLHTPTLSRELIFQAFTPGP